MPRMIKAFSAIKACRLLFILAIGAFFSIASLSCSGSSNDSQSSQPSKIKAGDSAPQFTAVDYKGKPYRLEDFRGQKVLLVFYMGYFCGGCKQNLSDLAKSADELKREAAVLAISVDPPSESVKMNQLLNGAFTLISDPELKIIRDYDVEMANMASPMADDWYVIIDKDGQISTRVQDTLFGQHADRILSALKKT